MGEICELEITRVGAQGDGVASLSGAPIYVPFTLEGEHVRAEIEGSRGRLLQILKPSPDRVAPVCQHFGVCGGCALQHMAVDTYRHWKRDQVTDAFSRRGLTVTPADLITTEDKRRRAVMTAERDEAGVTLGFHRALSHTLVDIAECPVLDDRIVARLPMLRAFLLGLMTRQSSARVSVTMTGVGLDVVIGEIRRKLTPDIRSSIAAQAAKAGIARVTIDDETVYEAQAPFLKFGVADVPIPPGTFVQAVAAAEAKMAELVMSAVGKAKSVVDLFSGAGALTFPLAARSRVSAFDSEAPAIEALKAGARRSTGLKPIEARVRDLFREPLSAMELNAFDAIVFDSPRAGAEAQAKMIARSKVKTVVAVSCNPASLARDARILIDGGLKLQSLTPVDQFVFSPHIEAVAVFRR